MRKGPNGRGTIFQDKAGRWWAQLSPDEATGKRPKRSAKTEAEAVQKLGELERERASGVNLSENPTVEHFLTAWLAIEIAPNVAGTTTDSYTYCCNHITAQIGRVRVRALSKAHAQQALNTLITSGLSIETVRTIRKRLIAALNAAVEWGLIVKNIARNTRIPTSGDAEPALHTWTGEQARRFLAAVAAHRLATLYLLALTLGMRQAELIGLRWTDVDLDRGELHIRSQIRRRKNVVERKKPKAKSARTIPLDDTLITALQAHWQNQQEERRITEGWKEHGLVFPSEAGTPLFATALWVHFTTMRDRAGLPEIRFHDLRHTAASLMLANGVPLADVSAILGHANPAITARIYLHSYEDGRRAAVATMGHLLQRRAL